MKVFAADDEVKIKEGLHVGNVGTVSANDLDRVKTLEVGEITITTSKIERVVDVGDDLHGQHLDSTELCAIYSALIVVVREEHLPTDCVDSSREELTNSSAADASVCGVACEFRLADNHLVGESREVMGESIAQDEGRGL